MQTFLRLCLILTLGVGALHVSIMQGAAASWWKPEPGHAWQIEYSGAFEVVPGVEIYNLDLFDTSSGRIQRLHDRHDRVICYFSAGSYENWRSDATSFPKAVIGASYDGWEGEWWLDIRATSVRTIMEARLDLAVTKRCDAVDPDNVDGFANDSGFDLSDSDQRSFNTWLATSAHERGLAISLKNDLDQIELLVRSFDFAVNESCFDHDECEALTPFIDAGKPVYQIQYPPLQPGAICELSLDLGFDTLFKDLDLTANRTACQAASP